MIRRCVIDVEKRFSRNRDYMLLANVEPFGCFETERKALHRPAENSLPNLTPLGPTGISAPTVPTLLLLASLSARVMSPSASTFRPTPPPVRLDHLCSQ